MRRCRKNLNLRSPYIRNCYGKFYICFCVKILTFFRLKVELSQLFKRDVLGKKSSGRN